MPKEIWVFVEQDHGAIAESSIGTLSEGERVADKLGSRLIALFLGSELADLGPALGNLGVDQVHLIQTKEFSRYVPGLYTRAVVSLLSKTHPSLFLLAGTTTGNDLAPRVAAHLGTACAPDASNLDMDGDGTWRAWRRVYNGRGDAQMRCSGAPVVVTLQQPFSTRGKARRPREPEVFVHSFQCQPTDLLVELVSHSPLSPRSMALDQADVLVVGGIGVGSKEGFEMLWELADLLGGTVGCTRAVTDQNWLTRDRLIGQTGATVNPRLLISCGVSGAIQHSIGMRGTGFLIAINRDRYAPIFQLADFAVVGDLHQIVPRLIENLRQMRTRCQS